MYKSAHLLVKRLLKLRSLIFTMAVQEASSRYKSSLAGTFWIVLQPSATIFTFWFVFTYGLKVTLPNEQPFILYFVIGLSIWQFFVDSVNMSISSLANSHHLIKKINFPTEILPIIQMIAALPSHFVILAIVAVIMLAGHSQPPLQILQLPYYLFAAACFSLAFSWTLSATNLFVRDVEQAFGAVTGIWFWVTPLVWDISILPEKWQWLLTLNPMYFVVQGYRDSLLNGVWFWERGPEAAYFWTLTLCLLAASGLIFRRLKSIFPEVV